MGLRSSHMAPEQVRLSQLSRQAFLVVRADLAVRPRICLEMIEKAGLFQRFLDCGLRYRRHQRVPLFVGVETVAGETFFEHAIAVHNR